MESESVETPFVWLTRNAMERPRGPALVTLKGAMAWSDFEVAVRRTAQFLFSQGVAPGSLVGLSLPANAQVIFTWAAIQLGATLVPTSSKLSAPLIGQLDAHVTVGESNPKDSAPLKIRVDSEKMREIQLGESLDKVTPYPSRYSSIVLLGTSGTTGGRKFATYDLATFGARGSRSIWGDEDLSGGVLNLFGLGQAAGFMANIQDVYFGRPMLLNTGNPNLNDTLGLLEKYRPTALRGSPNQVLQLVSHPEADYHRINSIRTISVVGAPLDDRAAKVICESIPEVVINVCYGSSEAGITHRRKVTSPPENQSSLLGSNVAGEVVVLDDQGQIINNGSVGRIAVIGENMVTEYFNNATATSNHFRQGYFISGDRGFIDERGQLHMEGREGDIINFGGTKVDPARIDNVALGRSGVNDACAFVVTDSLGSQQIGLALVLADPEFDLKQFAEELSGALGKVLMPRYIFKVGQIPRNEMGKPLRRLLSEKLRPPVRPIG